MIYKISLFFLILLSTSVQAVSVPSLSGPVVDQAGVLSNRYTNKIESYLHAVNNQTGNQIQVLIVNSLEGESIEGYSIKVVDEWKIGNKETDKGILFLMAMQERKMRIEVGQGLEGELTDLHARRIINGVKPYFRNGEYDAGVSYIIQNITTHIGADPSTVPRVKSRKRKKKRGMAIVQLIFLIFIFINFLRGVFGRGRGRGMASGIILGGTGGGWSSGGSSGGGWSGGGGGFSGGGSSGSW